MKTSSVTKIGISTFFDCTSLTAIILPSLVTKIGDLAFYKCSSLIQITIPSSVTSIGKGAFCGCSSLVQLSIPSSVTSFGNNEARILGYQDIQEYYDEINFVDELKNAIHVVNSTIYIPNLPVNNESNPPSCAFDENFIRNKNKKKMHKKVDLIYLQIKIQLS